MRLRHGRQQVVSKAPAPLADDWVGDLRQPARLAAITTVTTDWWGLSRSKR